MMGCDLLARPVRGARVTVDPEPGRPADGDDAGRLAPRRPSWRLGHPSFRDRLAGHDPRMARGEPDRGDMCRATAAGVQGIDAGPGTSDRQSAPGHDPV